MSILSGNMREMMDLLDKLSIAQIQQGMQRGQYPAYLAIPAIELKTRMQKQFEQQKLLQQPSPKEMPTVAEKVIQEAGQMGGGVEQLPSNLPQEYAQGGIVAFADGGKVERYQYGGSLGAEIGGYESEEPRVWNPFTGKYEPLTEEQKRQLEEGARMQQEAYGYKRPTPPAAPAAVMQPKPIAPLTPGAPPPATPTGISAFNASRELPKAPTPQAFGLNEQFARQEMTALQEAEAARRAAYEQQRKEVEGKIGSVPYEQLYKELEDEALKLGVDREKAKWAALAEAGFIMMGGSSRNAFENIAKGAQVGINSYKSALSDIKKAEKETRREKTAIEQARRAESLGDRDRQLNYMEKAYQAETESGRAMVNAIMKARGVDREEALKIWETEYKGATTLEGYRIAAGSRAEVAALRGALAGQRGGITPKDRLTAMKMVDPLKVDQEALAQMGLTSKPKTAAGVQEFNKIRKSVEARMLNEILSMMSGEMGDEEEPVALAGQGPRVIGVRPS